MAEDFTQPDAVTIEIDEEVTEDQLIDEVWVADSSGPSLLARLGAEVAGTFILVVMGVAAALFLGGSTGGPLAVVLAFGAAVVIGMVAFGHISGAHFNPAITVGVWVAGRFPGRDVAPYILAQLIGATIAGGALFALIDANPQFTDAKPVMESVANSFGEASLNQWGVGAALIVEAIATGILVIAFLAATAVRASRTAAPFVVGIAFAFVLALAIPVTNGSVNPARSSGIALLAGADSLTQLWVFWVAPVVGAAIVGLLYRAFGSEEDIEVVEVFEE